MLNPLLVKEIRVQSRGWESYAVGTIYVLALSALTFSLVWDASTDGATFDPRYGREMFLAFAVVLVLSISLICPAITAGAISSERERLTFDQLRVTLLRPYQLLVGKAGPSIIYILILLSASFPIAALIVPLGGVSWAEAASCYLIAFVSALAFSLTGLMCSSVYRNTRASTVMTYSIIGLFIFGTAVVPMILTGVFHVRVNRILLDVCIALNPLHAVLNRLGVGRQFQLAGLSPWTVAIVGYLVVSVVTACVALVRLSRMRS